MNRSPGAWQRNVPPISVDTALTYSAVFRCISLISSDIAKMRVKLVRLTEAGVWEETENPAFSPVLRKPNRWQTHIQFFSNWVESKLVFGNAYILKERDARNVVTRLYVLDPQRVTVLVAPDSSVYYCHRPVLGPPAGGTSFLDGVRVQGRPRRWVAQPPGSTAKALSPSRCSRARGNRLALGELRGERWP